MPWTAAVLGLSRLERGLSAVSPGAFDIPQGAKEWGELKNIWQVGFFLIFRLILTLNFALKYKVSPLSCLWYGDFSTAFGF